MAGAPPEEGARAWAQVLTPRWPQLPEWHPQFPSGVCCKQAPPETSGRKRKHLPKEQFPGLSVRGRGNHIPRQAQVSKLPPPPTPSRSRAGAPLCRAMRATRAPCRRDGTGQTHGHRKPPTLSADPGLPESLPKKGGGRRRWLLPQFTPGQATSARGAQGHTSRDVPGAPVVRTSPFNAGGSGSIPGQSFLPHGQKNQNM